MENYGRRIDDNLQSGSNGPLSGKHKAAALMLSLPPEHVEKVFGLLAESEVKDVIMAMSHLGQIDSAHVENIHKEFSDSIASPTTLMGTADSTKRLLSQFLEENKVKSIMDDIKGPEGRTIWEKLSNVNDKILATYLQKEYPQTIAVILSNIASDHTAKVLSNFSDELSIDVMQRMITIDSIQEEILKDIEDNLKTEFMGGLKQADFKNPLAVVAEIFNSFDKTTEEKFLGAIENDNADTAAQIRSLMFTFEDLVKLDDPSIQVLIGRLDKDKISLALKGASDEIKDLFFRNMSERAGKLMKEEMEEMGMVRLRDVEDAQVEIIKVTKALTKEGIVKIMEKNEDERLVG